MAADRFPSHCSQAENQRASALTNIEIEQLAFRHCVKNLPATIIPLMQHRPLGTSGLLVSALALGCMGMSDFYGVRDDAESTATIHRYLDLGGNFLDTADMYGPYTNEELIGGAIKGRRDQVILATKFGIVRDPNDPHKRGISGK